MMILAMHLTNPLNVVLVTLKFWLDCDHQCIFPAEGFLIFLSQSSPNFVVDATRGRKAAIFRLLKSRVGDKNLDRYPV
jgi:hypothetical protein